MSSVQEVMAREGEFYAAQTASDVAKLDEIMSQELSRFVHTTGLVETKAQYLAAARSGHRHHGKITRIHGTTRIFDGAAVTMGIIDMVSKPAGEPEFAMRVHQVLVWAREDGRWRLTERQATRQPI